MEVENVKAKQLEHKLTNCIYMVRIGFQFFYNTNEPCLRPFDVPEARTARVLGPRVPLQAIAQLLSHHRCRRPFDHHGESNRGRGEPILHPLD